MRLPLNPFSLLPRPEAAVGLILAAVTAVLGGSPFLLVAGAGLGLWALRRQRRIGGEALVRARPQALDPHQVAGLERAERQLGRLFKPAERPRVAVIKDVTSPYRLGIGLRDADGYRLIIGADLLADIGQGRFSEPELRALLAHEAAHVRHGDVDALTELGQAAYWGVYAAVAHAALCGLLGIGFGLATAPASGVLLLAIGALARPLRAAGQRAGELRADAAGLRQPGVDADVAERALYRYLAGEACAEVKTLSRYGPEQAARIGAHFLARRRRELDAEGMAALTSAYLTLAGQFAYGPDDVDVPPRSHWQQWSEALLLSHPPLPLRLRALRR